MHSVDAVDQLNDGALFVCFCFLSFLVPFFLRLLRPLCGWACLRAWGLGGVAAAFPRFVRFVCLSFLGCCGWRAFCWLCWPCWAARSTNRVFCSFVCGDHLRLATSRTAPWRCALDCVLVSVSRARPIVCLAVFLSLIALKIWYSPIADLLAPVWIMMCTLFLF